MVYEHVKEGEIRILLYGHYRIAYLKINRERIDILGIFHGALEIDKYLIYYDKRQPPDILIYSTFIHMKSTLNSLGKSRTPFIFIINFDMTTVIARPVTDIDRSEILYDFNGITNALDPHEAPENISFEKFPMAYEDYLRAFNIVVDNEIKGNSYLANLTFPTEIKTSLSLDDIFHLASAKYRLRCRDTFVCFSPETFVRIDNGIISSYPMKGTIDASIPNAAVKILADEKELAEHITIVDLIRNDLNMVAEKITVEKFRYIDRIKTLEKELLQVSSKITGRLAPGYHERIGDILLTLLPAGSITGAPKKKTVEIIKKAENYDRGFYTGIAGYFDGKDLDSCVMIRFIEKNNDRMVFKSGGGITVYSDARSEYNEMVDKVNVPVS